MFRSGLVSWTLALVALAALGCTPVVTIGGGEGEGQDGVNGVDGDEDGEDGEDGDAAALGILEDCDTDAGYEVNAFDAAPGADGVPLRLVGVYESNGDHSFNNHPQGTFDVTVDTPGAQYLALSAYEPTAWTVHVGPDTQLLGVFAIGYHEQVVIAPPGVPVVTDSYETGGDFACGYSWPYNGEGCDTDELVTKIEAMAARPISTFRGCYHMTQLTFLP